ncbi:MAG: hypothetical protein HQL67_01975 [Magnetococcales bacterium]|nr:hypothetical protein [Magnetococcales bacterium]
MNVLPTTVSNFKSLQKKQRFVTRFFLLAPLLLTQALWAAEHHSIAVQSALPAVQTEPLLNSDPAAVAEVAEIIQQKTEPETNNPTQILTPLEISGDPLPENSPTTLTHSPEDQAQPVVTQPSDSPQEGDELSEATVIRSESVSEQLFSPEQAEPSIADPSLSPATVIQSQPAPAELITRTEPEEQASPQVIETPEPISPSLIEPSLNLDNLSPATLIESPPVSQPISLEMSEQPEPSTATVIESMAPSQAEQIENSLNNADQEQDTQLSIIESQTIPVADSEPALPSSPSLLESDSAQEEPTYEQKTTPLIQPIIEPVVVIEKVQPVEPLPGSTGSPPTELAEQSDSVTPAAKSVKPAPSTVPARIKKMQPAVQQKPLTQSQYIYYQRCASCHGSAPAEAIQHFMAIPGRFIPHPPPPYPLWNHSIRP